MSPRLVTYSRERSAAPSRRWLALAVLALAQFMLFLDETIVNVALPSIKDALGFSQAGLAWVIDAYILLFGGFLLLGGRAADIFGRRRMFLVGTALFGLASLLVGLAQSQQLLIGARALQGIGAALATPAALALVTTLFTEDKERAKALGVWGGLAGLGFASGVLLGGLITDLFEWRWVFLINVPVALLVLAAVPRIVPESRPPTRPSFDLAGAAAITGALTTFVFAILETGSNGWLSHKTTGLLSAATALLVVFVAVERRSSAPLVPARLVKRRTTIAANVIQYAVAASLISSFFLLTLYLQQVLGYSPLRAGLAYIPLAAMFALAMGSAGKLAPLLGVRPLIAGGLVISAVGLVLFAHLPVEGNYLTDVLPALLLMALGGGWALVSVTMAALAKVDESVAGLASGLLNSSGQLGGAVGVAVLAAIAANRGADALASGATPLAAQVEGFRLAFFIAAAISLAGAVVAAVTLERLGPERTGPELAAPQAARVTTGGMT
jgi:EmrB/QacA subfamily drug resistance transporter